MKVLYFTRSQSPHDLRFTSALAETRHKVFVLCLEPDGHHKWPQGIYEVAWPGIDLRQGWLVARAQLGRLKTVLDTIKPDLVHAGPIQSAAWLTALTGFHPLVSMSWGSDLMLDAGRNEIMRRLTRFTLAHSDVLVGDCSCVGQKAHFLGFGLENYRQFPWGVDLTNFSPVGTSSLRAKLGWQDKTVLLSSRSFEPIYGVDVLIKSFAKAAKENSQLRMLILGRGSLERKLKLLAKSLGLADKVVFHGTASTNELPDVYRSADLYMSASHSDGSSVSLMEALACGLPVLVSDIPGNREWVFDGQQGWLFKDGNVQDCTRKMQLAISKMKDFENMAKSNRKLAEDRADWKMNFPVLLEAYDLAAGKAGTHA